MSVLEEIALRQSIFFTGLVLALGFALIYAAFYCYRGPGWVKTGVKAVPLTALTLGAAANFAALPVVAALALSALGDIALSRAGQRAFLAGLCAFALAHLAYLVQFLTLVSGPPPLLPALGLIALALSTEIWLTPWTGTLRWPVRVYVALIAAMGLAALALPDGRALATWGALAFILSDAILGLVTFRLSDTARGRVAAAILLWTLYIAGQVAILLGAGFARPIFHL